MEQDIRIIDLFSGPGGLGEGFASFRRPDGTRPYGIAISIEKDEAAHRTLRLRAFLRRFEALPEPYLEWLANWDTRLEPNWSRLYPDEWAEAEAEACRAELGTPAGTEILDRAIERVRGSHGDRTILIGGPPCQAYSIVGRVRNGGIATYRPEEDARHFLYREYVAALTALRPAAFVMENVKGLLSSSVSGSRIVRLVLEDLRNAGYTLVSLSPSGLLLGEPEPADFVVKAEDFGVPQARHRVIIVGIRRDIAERMPPEMRPMLRPKAFVPVEAVIGDMPPVRSGLSNGDGGSAWRGEVIRAVHRSRRFASTMPEPGRSRFLDALASVERDLPDVAARGRRGSVAGQMSCPGDLRSFMQRHPLPAVVQHETRSHMAPDLGRYLFAACWAKATGRSPRGRDFPDHLAPEHRNWTSGSFADRFRVQVADQPATTVVSHIAKDGHYYIHYDPAQCRSLTVREAARIQTFPDDYVFLGNRTQCYGQIGNAVPPYLARQVAEALLPVFDHVA